MTANELLVELHPGRTIAEDVLRPLGMSVNALAGELHVPATRLNEIVRGRRGVTADTALRLARLFWNDGTLPAQSANALRPGTGKGPPGRPPQS